jgi:hypothetical protein
LQVINVQYSAYYNSPELPIEKFEPEPIRIAGITDYDAIVAIEPPMGFLRRECLQLEADLP